MNGTKPLALSIVMCVYNGERFLSDAIESILNQTFRDFEFIIINDGSNDRSVDIVKSFKDKRIKLINQANHGFIFSLNKGVNLAQSDLIARMDHDDISLPTRLEKQMKLIGGNPKMGAVSTFFELINFESGRPLGTTLVFPPNNIDLKRYMYINNPMAHGCTIFRKAAWLEAGKYSSDYAPPEDYDLWRKIAKNWEIGMVPEVLFQYRINNPESMSQKNALKVERNFNRIRTELINGPFIYKSISKLRSDYKVITPQRYLKYANEIKNEYVNMQFSIARIFLENNSPRKAFSATIFIALTRPRNSVELFAKYPKCLYINISRRLKLRNK